MKTADEPSLAYRIVAIGTSWGGLDALSEIFGALPAEFPLPLVVVQHRGAETDDGMVAHLQRGTRLRVREADDKLPLKPGWIYFAPAGYHLAIESGRASLSLDARVNFARPAIDVLFDSVARAYGRSAIGVILTGASDDGARGLTAIKDAGGVAIVEDPDGAALPVMPRAARDAAKPQHVVAIGAIAPLLCALARQLSEDPIARRRPPG